MGRRITPPKRVTSHIWGAPRPCKQDLTPHLVIAPVSNTKKQPQWTSLACILYFPKRMKVSGEFAPL